MKQSEINEVLVKFAKGETCRLARQAMVLGYLQGFKDAKEVIQETLGEGDLAIGIRLKLELKEISAKKVLRKV